ncbi:DUF177 domain-containing protein [Sphingosinicella sp. CPCC 101087]|uniref:DUF177 domain-containing protein n=1 Tax=Sphingosinicella sp. CPCC 101087 TaxID=2497754 RepID=UPI00101C6D8C|nr:DUF177 domain-containing protein [Sphingosinicella sp. CPCC 101087]
MTRAEFSRPFRVDALGAEPRTVEIEADPEERAALARRFGLVEIGRLAATAALSRRDEEVVARGRVTASVMQSCVASGDPVRASVDEPFEISFRPLPSDGRPDEEVELSEAELDVVFYEGGAVDVGEAVAETLSLSLDPFPRAPNAAEALKAAGVKSEEEAGPFGALAALRDKMRKQD